MNIHPLKTEEDYGKAIQRIDALMDALPGTKEGDELDVLATLVEAYERSHFPIDPPDPVAAILFRMEQMGIDRKALEPFLGERSFDPPFHFVRWEERRRALGEYGPCCES